MANPDQTYRSLVMRKVQQLAKEHGGLAKIPKSIQQKLGFDVIAKRKGTSISVRIPEGELASRIAELKKELPSVSFKSAKPDTEAIFGKYTPRVSEENPTMEDFWIMQGWYTEDRSGIRLTLAKWKDDEGTQKEAVRFLVEKILKKPPRDITQDNFNSNRLGGLLISYYKSSQYEALVETGYAYSVQESLRHAKTGKFQTDKIYPWEMKMTPDAFVYKRKENRIAATKWLVWKLKKFPRDILKRDFHSNRLGGLLNCYNNSPYESLIEAGYAYSIQELLQHARTDNFQNEKIYPWELLSAPNAIYHSQENRIAATKWLVWKLKKTPRDFIQEDFYSNRLNGLLNAHYNNSPYAAIFEAGFVTSIDEQYMRSSHHTHGKGGNP